MILGHHLKYCLCYNYFYVDSILTCWQQAFMMEMLSFSIFKEITPGLLITHNYKTMNGEMKEMFVSIWFVNNWPIKSIENDISFIFKDFHRTELKIGLLEKEMFIKN